MKSRNEMILKNTKTWTNRSLRVQGLREIKFGVCLRKIFKKW